MGGVDFKGWGGVEKVAISNVRNFFWCRTEHIWRVDPTHWQNQINAQEGLYVCWKWGHNVGKGVGVRRAQEAPVEGVGNVPFGEPHRAIRSICLPNILQEPGKACLKLHGVGGSRFVGGRVDSRGNIIRCRRRITDQAGISVRLIHRRKARDTDAVAKKQ